MQSEEGMNSTVKFRELEFKRYLHGDGDAGARLLLSLGQEHMA